MVKTYNMKELEEVLKVNNRTIGIYIRDGILKATKVKKNIIVQEKDLIEFLNKYKV